MSASPLCESLREYRERRGYSRADLAYLSGVSEDLISELEAPAGPTPNASTVKALADALAVEPEQLVGRGPALLRIVTPPEPEDSR